MSKRRMRKSRQRLIVIGVVGALLSFAIGLSLFGMRDSVAYFYAPSEVAAKAEIGQRVRIGGLVEIGSVARAADGRLVFAITDGAARLPVFFGEEPPNLFAENQGVVAEGVWRGDGVLTADRVLAKHDETYMPKEAVEAMKRAGTWKGEP
jgi:cytochrome c-type biogenesis protein CcmE